MQAVGENMEREAKTSRPHPVTSGSEGAAGGVFLGILTVQRGLPECGAVPKIRGVKPCPLTWQHPTSAPTLHSAPYLERAVIVPHCTDEAAEAPGGEGTEQRRGRCGWYQAGRGSGKQS